MDSSLDRYWYRVYVRNPGNFDRIFIELCLQRFGMKKKGAKKHYDMLTQHCPAGYIYACRIKIGESEYLSYRQNANFKVVEVPCFDDLGDLIKGYAYVFKLAPDPIIPAEYQSIAHAPKNMVVRVCWGSLASSIEYGSAKLILNSWYIYGQRNPHADHVSCPAPTGWYEENK